MESSIAGRSPLVWRGGEEGAGGWGERAEVGAWSVRQCPLLGGPARSATGIPEEGRFLKPSGEKS